MLNINLIVGIIISFLIGALAYVTNDYFSLKRAYAQQEKTIEFLEHTRKSVEKAMVSVEHNYQNNDSIQRKSLEEIHKQGHLSCCNGHNPKWMLEYQTNNHESKHHTK